MGFRLRQFLAALIIFGALTSGLVGFAGDVFDTYGSQGTDLSVLEDQADRTFEETNSTVNQQQEQAEEVKGDITQGLFILNTIGSVITLTITSITSFYGLVTTLSGQLHIPTWLIGMVTTIISIYIIYEIVTLYRGIRS